MDIIEIKNLNYNYDRYDDAGNKIGAKSALVDINLNVHQGEFLVIAGRNGSGKSTLAKIFNALLLPSTGEAKIFGMDTKDTTLTLDIRRKVGMIFQNPDNQLVQTIVEDDVAFGPENLRMENLPELVKTALENVGMEDYALKDVNKLSGGQKQKVAIAGMLAIKPEIMIFDESTSMLDPEARKELLSIISRLHKEEGKTIILITHLLEEAVNANRIIVLDKGKIVKDGNVCDVLYDDNIEDYGIKAPVVVQLAKGLGLKNITKEEELLEQIL